MDSELYLFVIWEKARPHAEKIVADIARHMKVLAVLNQSWPTDACRGYARFYGAKAKLAAGKVESCGGGSFVTVIAEDTSPRYGWRETSRGTECVNLRAFLMKQRYRGWANGGHCVHSTNSRKETTRDVFLLTGRTYDEWRRNRTTAGLTALPGEAGWRDEDELRRALESVGARAVTADAGAFVVENRADCASVINARAVSADEYEVSVGGRSRRIRLLLEPDFETVDARIARAVPPDVRALSTVDYATDLRRTFKDDWKWSCRFWKLFPDMCHRPRCYRLDLQADDYGVFARARIEGETLESVLDRGISSEQAEWFADRMADLADALETAGICHREINPRTLIVGSDGRLRIRDFRFATSLSPRREPRWMEKSWRLLADLNAYCRPAPWTWSDRHSFDQCVRALPDFPRKDEVLRRIDASRKSCFRKVRFRFNFALRMWLCGRFAAALPAARADARFDGLVDELKRAAWAKGVGVDRLCLVGSAPLNVFGLRRCGDVDYLLADAPADFAVADRRLSAADDDLRHYPVGKDRLVDDPAFHFRYRGVKVITLGVLDAFKRRRNRSAKDRRDRILIRAVCAKSLYARWLDVRYLLLKVREGIYFREKVDGVRRFRVLGFIRFTRGKR